ncbi:MAG TPA: DUF308 domain-containing protein [Coriobacteriia bacterium]|nr:DUF308 domain-containing protein [Coriobacteriia bacterium]
MDEHDTSAFNTHVPEPDAPDGDALEAQMEEQVEEFLANVPWWVVLLEGMAVLGLGVLLLLKTEVTTLVLVSFFGWYWLIHGFFELASLTWDRSHWGWRVLSGVLGVLAGLYVVSAPVMGAAVVLGVATIMLGINGAIIGASSLAKAVAGGGWGVGIFGALSLVIGLSIALRFPEYMGALPWVWGVMAMIAGAAGVAAAVRIRKIQAA